MSTIGVTWGEGGTTTGKVKPPIFTWGEDQEYGGMQTYEAVELAVRVRNGLIG